jgi:hypothetical protein
MIQEPEEELGLCIAMDSGDFGEWGMRSSTI